MSDNSDTPSTGLEDIPDPDPGHGTSGVLIDLRTIDGKVVPVLDAGGEDRAGIVEFDSAEAALSALGELPPDSLVFHDGEWIA